MEIIVDKEQLASVQHLLNLENKLILKIHKSAVTFRHDSIWDNFNIDDYFLLQGLGITHQKIRQMWDDDDFENCLRYHIMFVFELREYPKLWANNQEPLFTMSVHRGKLVYFYSNNQLSI